MVEVKYRMADILKPAESENFMVDIFEVSQEDVDRVRLRDMFRGGREYHGFEKGRYARLSHRENGQRSDTIMSDTWMERRTNWTFIDEARGDVLIGGLGIGMVLLEVQDKPEVTSITVVEKNAEVIDLVKPQLPLNEKVKIVHCDIFDYKPEQMFDTIYFDIWDTISGDNYPEMKKLHRRFSRKLNKGGWMNSWRRDDCRRAAQDN